MLPDALRARGAEVDVLALYETLAEPLSPQTLQAVSRADYITFTSSSTVRFFLEAAERRAPSSRRAPASSRSGPSPARSCASTEWSPMWRPIRTTSRV